MKISSSVSIALIFVALWQLGCKSENAVSDLNSTVTVRLPNEPDMLNPARSNSSYATQIESHIMLPLAEMDPVSYQMTPLLAESYVKGEPITSGVDSGGVQFSYTIRKEAVWDNGTPVTGQDYAFTVKMALNTRLDVLQWRGFLTVITDVQIDPDDPAKFTVIMNERHMLADLIACNFNIYPEYVYDSAHYMRAFTVRQLTDEKTADSLANVDERMQLFADAFKQVKYAKEIVSGSGPYRLASWETGQRIVLERKADWWGDKVSNGPLLLHAYPQTITYEIIPDEKTALTMLKDGTIDVMSDVSPSNFVELRADSTYKDKLNFYTPKLLLFYYLELNNHNPILSDKNVRKALAYIVDCDGIIENVVMGMGQRTIGPFHPDAEYYNKDVLPVPYDPDRARALLSEAGWTDSNGDGVVDKVVDGVRTELKLSITVSQKIEGQTIATLLKESAAKVGIDIEIVTKDGAMITQDARNRAFDILPLRWSADVTLSDPYQLWHSDSDAPGGSNHSGFRNATADSLITVIRTTEETSTRNNAYRALQVILADEQPVIFLYVPQGRLIVSKKFEIQPSSRRPGYFENLFKRLEM